MTKLSLLAIVFGGLSVAACTSSSSTSTVGQMITCQTDPSTGVITQCAEGDGSGSGTCHDIDEDGDGDPHDDTTSDGSGDDSGHHDSFAAPDDDGGGSADSDGDGIPDSDDCDNRHGEDDDSSDELPYDVRPALGATTQPIQEAFAEKGGQPAAIDSVTLEGGSWRLAELQAGTAFLVTEDDCTHRGNRDVGRDRVIVTWRDDLNGVSQSDHLDIRYCQN